MWDMFFRIEPMTWRWKSCGWLVVMLISVGTAGCGERVVDAPPAKVAFEGSMFRILDVNVPPGTTLQHSYKNGVAMAVMTDGSRIRMRPSGGDWGDPIVPGVGSITVAEAGEHGVQNVGEGPFQLLALENLRPGGGSTAAPLAAKGITLVGESPSFRAYEAQLADNNLQISHVHAAPAVAILIKGKVLSQGPENKDKAIGEVASGLKQLDRTGQWLFIPAGEAHYVVKLGADPAHIVEVELR
jgi:hypothetical protein